jgi:uncharacterized protein (TIGR02996 family)
MGIIMNTNEGQALLACVQENLADLAPQLIYSDWLEEQGRLQEALLWRGQKITKLDLYNLYNHGYGDGRGDGYGDGRGDGYGDGDGDGLGDGYSNGDGLGDGYSNGDGNGDGLGDGYSNGDGNGDGYGDGDGDGDGDGFGYGFGFGRGRGDGYGFGLGNQYIQKQNAWLYLHKQIIDFKNYE